MDLDEALADALRAILESQRPQAGSQAAVPLPVSQPQPSVPYAYESSFPVTLTNATSNRHYNKTSPDRSHQDVSYGQDCHPNISPTGFTSPNNSEYLTLAQPSHLEARTPTTRKPTLRINTSVPAIKPSMNLPPQQGAAEGEEATNTQMSQPSEGSQLPSFTQNLTLDPASANAPWQQTAFGGVGDTYMQTSQPSEGASLSSFTHNPILNPVARPIDDIQAMAGAQVNQGQPGDYHQGHDQSVTSTMSTCQPLTSTNLQLPNLQTMAGAQVHQRLPGAYNQGHDQSATTTASTRQPLNSTNIQLPHPRSRVSQTNLYQPIPQGTGITAQPVGPPQAPDPKGPDPTYRNLDPASIALQLEAYNDRILAKKGLLSLREKLEAQNRVRGDAITAFNAQLPSREHRDLALADVQARFKNRTHQHEPANTIRRILKLEIIKAECWIEWGKEMHVDTRIHETRLYGFTKILDLLGPEAEMPSLAPLHDAGNQPTPPQLAAPIPLNIEQLDLSQIYVTADPKQCHWCRDEQPWGIPGGIHFKPYEENAALDPSPAHNADPPSAHDDAAAADYVSTMCRPCFAYRRAVGTHALHGPFADLPRATPSADPHLAPGPKAYMRQTSCAVCSGLADGICGGCPLRVCVNCQVVLDSAECGGRLDRLLGVYGEGGRRNDARLLGSGLAWSKGEGREVEMGEGVEEEVGEEDEDDDDEEIEGEFGRVWREIRMRDRGY